MKQAGRASGLRSLMRFVEASTKSAGPSCLGCASSFAALIASWLAAGRDTPLHSTRRHDFEASMLSAGVGVALMESAGIASQVPAGASKSLFTTYRQQLEVDSEHDFDNNTFSTPFSAGSHSLGS